MFDLVLIKHVIHLISDLYIFNYVAHQLAPWTIESWAFASSMAAYFKGSHEERNRRSNALREGSFQSFRASTSHSYWLVRPLTNTSLTGCNQLLWNSVQQKEKKIARGFLCIQSITCSLWPLVKTLLNVCSNFESTMLGQELSKLDDILFCCCLVHNSSLMWPKWHTLFMVSIFRRILTCSASPVFYFKALNGLKICIATLTT